MNSTKYNLQKIKKNGRTLPRIEPRHLLLSPRPFHYTTRLSVFTHGRLCQCCPFHLHRRETVDNEKAQRVIHHFTFEFVFTEFIDKNIITAANEVCKGYVFTGVCLSTKGGARVVGGGMHGKGAYVAKGCVAGEHTWQGGHA